MVAGGWRGIWLPAMLIAAMLSPGLAIPASAQVVANDVSDEESDHSPRGALYRALVVPGWGQVYNRQYYKLPFVYGGLAGISYGAYANHRSYTLYREAYLFAEPRLWEEGAPQYPEYEASYHRMLRHQGLAPDDTLSPDDAETRRTRLAPGLRQTRDNLRRNRDLLYIGVGLFYAITVLDAYVSAHLLDFDVGDDLSLGFYPAPMGVHARLQINF